MTADTEPELLATSTPVVPVLISRLLPSIDMLVDPNDCSVSIQVKTRDGHAQLLPVDLPLNVAEAAPRNEQLLGGPACFAFLALSSGLRLTGSSEALPHRLGELEQVVEPVL